MIKLKILTMVDLSEIMMVSLQERSNSRLCNFSKTFSLSFHRNNSLKTSKDFYTNLQRKDVLPYINVELAMGIQKETYLFCTKCIARVLLSDFQDFWFQLVGRPGNNLKWFLTTKMRNSELMESNAGWMEALRQVLPISEILISFPNGDVVMPIIPEKF